MLGLAACSSVGLFSGPAPPCALVPCGLLQFWSFPLAAFRVGRQVGRGRASSKECGICSSFKLFLELEPQVRDIIFKFYESKYASCLKMLDEMKVRDLACFGG